MNLVCYFGVVPQSIMGGVLLLKTPFHSLGCTEKVWIKTEGRPLPEISFMKKGEKVKAFNTNWYQKYSWLTGSLSSSHLYCWPCLLFGKPWSKGGYSDLKNIDRSAKWQNKSMEHKNAHIKFKLLGTSCIDYDEGLRIQTAQRESKKKQGCSQASYQHHCVSGHVRMCF